MKQIILFLILASSYSFGDWGDTYYCTLTSWTKTDLSGKKSDVGAGTPFKFQLSKEKKSMIFDKSVPFYNDEFKIMDMHLEQTKDVINDVWYAGGLGTAVLYNEGVLVYAHAMINSTESKIATCSRF